MCGGDLEIRPGESVATCEYCGTTQTLPKLDDDRRSNLYDRANHFRRNNEFDKAMGIYEQILNEDGSDAEAYWSIVLCRYGIEYVEDPASHKRIPTVNRAQYTSIFADENYKSALEHADGLQREIYEAEAKAIDEIQKGILEISSKEEPFDVFICYKETDANGRRTVDSVLATDLYHQLTQEGFKVFFSRITLEDKLGVAYEPYIFAALNSAKVMVALGTKPEYFNAVWVKNEWSRYLALVKQSGGKKILIPAYRDMDPYDLPEEFSHLQAQDMSKLGFMQDLIRGIKKILAADKPKETVKETVVMSAAQTAVAPLLKRAFIFLEDRDWKSADEYCEKVLDTDPENAQAYLGKLLASIQVRNPDSLSKASQPFANNPNYAKCVRYGDKTLREKLEKDNQTIKDRLEEQRLSGLYQKAEDLQRRASTEQQYLEAAKAFTSISTYRNATVRAEQCRKLAEEIRIRTEEQKREALYERAKDLAEIASDEKAYKEAAAAFEKVSGYKDADELARQCLEKAEVSRKDEIYNKASAEADNAESIKAIGGYESAISQFRSISGWRDADEKVRFCEQKIRELHIAEEAAKAAAAERAKKNKKILIGVFILLAVAAAAVIFFVTTILPKQKQEQARKYLEAGQYDEAYALLEEIGDTDAIVLSKYDRAIVFINSGDYEAAYMLLNGLNYKDSTEQLESIKPQYQRILLSRAKIGNYVTFGSYEQDNDTSNGKEDIEWIVLEKDEKTALLISRYALDCQKYNASSSTVTWETCSLRTWLNGTFLDAAFSEEAKDMLLTKTVTADQNPIYLIDPGKDTEDKIFLLSLSEVEEYFSSDRARICYPTAYAKAQGALASNTGEVKWWLRSPGGISTCAAGVYTTGKADPSGNDVSDDWEAVRPALWINLGSEMN